MEPWIERLLAEYNQLDKRTNSLEKMINDYAKGNLDYIPKHSLELLTMQLNHMTAYRNILKIRLKQVG